MAEDTNAAVDAGGAQGAGDSGNQGAAAVDELKDLTLGDGAEAVDDSPPSWREDWREALAGGDEKELARLKRFASLENLHKSYRQMEARLSKGQAAATLPENATEDEVAAYRKAHGIPEKADGYGVAFPEEMKPSEADKAALNAFSEFMLGRNARPAEVKAAFEWYTQNMQAGLAAKAEAARAAEQDAIVALRTEYGRDYKRNIAIAYETLERYAGDAAPKVAGIMLADGRPLGKHEDFMRFLVATGRATADEEMLIAGDGAGGGKSLEDEKKELLAISASGKRLTKEQDARLNQIYEALTAKEARQGRARAA